MIALNLGFPMRTIVIGFCVAIAVSAVAQESKAPALTPEEQKLAAEATKLSQEGVQLFQRGQRATGLEKMQLALEIRRKVYSSEKFPDGHKQLVESLANLGAMFQMLGEPQKAVPLYQQRADMNRLLYSAARFPDGHLTIAESLNSLAQVLQAAGDLKKAESVFEQSLEMRRKLYSVAKNPDGHAELANGLNNLGNLLQVMGQFERAADLFQQSLDMRRKLYPVADFPNGHVNLANSLNNLGSVLRDMGQAEKAVTVCQQCLDMLRKLYPVERFRDGNLFLAYGLNGMGFALESAGQAEKAAAYLQECLDMRRKHYPAAQFPRGHPELAQSLNNMGFVLESMGQPDKAATYFQQGLEMRQQLYPAANYPHGHPELAQSLNNLGAVLQTIGQAQKAADLYQQGLDMRRLFYPAAKFPDGHPDLVRSLNNLAFALTELGQTEKAAAHFQQCLDMNRSLYPPAKYPNGHPQLAASLNNMGGIQEAMAQPEKAVNFYQQCLEMRRQLFPVANYPDGHPELAQSLNSVGSMMHALGRMEKAAPFVQASLEMQQRIMQRELLTASESAAFDRIAVQPLTRDGYLSVTRSLNLSAGDCYKLIAPSRSVIMRVLEQRLASAHVAGTAVADQIDQLRSNRRRTDQVLQDPRLSKDDRDKLLIKYADERDKLERALFTELPLLKRRQELDQLGPEALVQALPPESVFIDLISYQHIQYPKGTAKRVPSYVAFVLAKGRPIQRIELDAAKPIDDAVAVWRKAIEARGTDSAGTILKEKIWDQLAGHLPAGTKTIYLAADADLARVPWAALPIAKDRVLLEDFAISQVPHGVFLLDRLKVGRKADGAESLLTLGGLDFGKGVWPALPGTLIETKAIAAIAPGQRESLEGKDATPAKFTESVIKARYIHLATHGEFKAESLTAERKRAAEALKAREFADNNRKVAAKNPLGYVGLVLSNGEVLSGLSIVDLPLKKTQLVTLSACETGLGEYTAGEGVLGLQRAFHLAGCPNVVASLWNVNDAATAALMAKFYHEMWVNRKPPIEALRDAQLTIYYHPELIPDLAGERGAPKLKDAIAVKSSKPGVTATGVKRPDTKLWAAFVLSGAGN